ncbi:uncharacterized protein LOC130272784 [Hyla sarda]|uniref:uncharacterized protein LOC130272784 n=1 Tax=Hyla sarda TaxID=327740 RepID=UPI0024C3BD78|nr:uncharacterized protein LOC130272784 [Hyla sarda]
MDRKNRKSRRTTQEMVIYPPLPKEECLKSCNENNEKTAVVDKCDPSLAKNTKINLLKPNLKIDKKLPKKKTVISIAETAPTKREATPIVCLSNSLYSLKLSSTDSKTTDIFQPRRPVKLAPLELPAKVKEAQIKKINTMTNIVYLKEQEPSHHNIPYQCPTKREPLKKMRENKLPRLPEDVTLAKDNVLDKDVSGRINSLPRDFRLEDSSLSLIKSDTRCFVDSVPKITSPQNNESRNVFAEGRFRSSRCQNINLGSRCDIKTNGY